MRPMWVKSHSIQRRDHGGGRGVTFVLRMENEHRVVEVELSPGRLAKIADEAIDRVPRELLVPR